MPSIDDKVVAMSFESAKFESGVNNAISALEKLKSSLKLQASSKSLDDVGAAAKRIDLSHIGKGIDAIQQKLGYFSVATLAIFANIAAKAVQTGAAMVKSFTLDPLISGFKEYSTNLNSIQTILANTQASGATLKDVNASLLELNKYSDQTIYNFSQMAKNIGTFTAAGVELDTATASIKGIANLAALSGSNAEQASTAMYQLSQAISAGKVSLQDWNSVVNAGMGGTVFQRALAQTAEAMGTLEKGAVSLKGPMKNVSIEGRSFRESITAKPGEKSWLTSDVLTSTLKQFTGDLSKAELAAMGFNAAQIKAIQQTAKTARAAATEVKTIAQVMDVAKETAGSGWAQTWQIIFGDFGEAKKTFTELSQAINGFINTSSDARNKVLADWKALGGRTALINGIKVAFHNLSLIIAPIKDAFREIFPAKTGQDLFNATKRFQEFAAALKPSAQTVDNLKRTFSGLFAAFSIGIQIVKGIFSVFGQLFGALGSGNGGFLSLTASIGDFFVSVDKAMKKGDGLKKFFDGLGNVLSKPIEMLSKFAGVLGNLFSGFSSGGISSELSGIGAAMTPLQKIMKGIANAWDKFTNSLKDSVDMSSVVENIGKSISGIGVAIGKVFSNINFEAILSVIRTGLFAALVVMFKQFLGKGSMIDQIGKGFAGGILENISGVFSGLNGSMKAMQQNLKAKTLKEIAIAIALLAASVLMLSLVDPERLSSSLGAMTILFGELIAAMAILDKVTKSAGFLKMPFIAGSLIALSIAINLLTLSVLAMSRLSWNDLLKGLAGVGGLLAGISLAVQPLSAGSAGLIRAGIGIIAIAVAMKILASAMADFGAMSWGEITKGLAGVGAGLGIISVAARAMPTGMVAMGAGLVIVATGLKILADAVLKFGMMDWKTMGKGLAGIGGSLVVIAGAMQLMPKNMPLTAAGLAIVALSLGKIADAVIKMGGMSIKEIAKGIGTLAGSLTILAVALRAMTGSVSGAAALTITAAGIAILAPAMVLLGKQSWGNILKGMVALGAALAIIGVAGYALGPVIPALMGLGVAVVLIGGGLALAGVGILAFSAGLSALAVAGPAAVGILVAAINEFLAAIPKMATNFALGLLSVVEAFAKTAPKFVAALVKIIDQLLDVIIKSSPKIAEAFIALLDAALTVLRERQGEIIAAGISLLLALLNGIKQNIGQLVTVVADIIVRFLNALSSNLGRIVTAGADVLVSLLKGIANNLANVATAAISIITKFVGAIATGLGQVATAGLSILTKLLKAIADNIGKAIKAGTDVIIAFIKGVGDAGPRIIRSAVEAIAKFIHAIGQNAVKLADEGAQAIINFLNGVADVIEKREPEMLAAGARIGVAIVQGMINGIGSLAQTLYNKAKEVAETALSYLKKPWKIFNPSQATIDIGVAIVEGMVRGIDYNAQNAYASATAMSNGVISAFTNTFQTASPSKVMMEIGKFVGQGFAQGLRGSQEDINAAFAEMNSKLTEIMSTARETIEVEQDKLNKLREANKPDAEAIKASQKIIAENETLLKNSTAARFALINTLKDEHSELGKLANQYDVISEKIRAAQAELAKQIQERNELQASLTKQYSTGPTMNVDTDMTQINSTRTALQAEQDTLSKMLLQNSATAAELEAQQKKVTESTNAYNTAVAGRVLTANGTAVDQLASYMEALKNQTAAVGAYDATLKQLRQLGLDDTTYRRLLEEGTADQSFANQLLAGGKTAVAALNTLDKNLQKVSERLATEAAKNLEQGGVDGAKGLLKGLTSQNQKIRNAMDDIIEDIIRIIKNKMKIKSPSKVFEEIGGYAMQGLANGFSKSSKVVTDTVKQSAKDTLLAMRESLRNGWKYMTDDLNMNPVITPVLDLSLLRNQARGMKWDDGLMVGLNTKGSYGQASNISRNFDNYKSDGSEVEDNTYKWGTRVKFEQNNYSPKALTEIEIYRQTKNQLSQLKSVLGTH